MIECATCTWLEAVVDDATRAPFTYRPMLLELEAPPLQVPAKCVQVFNVMALRLETVCELEPTKTRKVIRPDRML